MSYALFGVSRRDKSSVEEAVKVVSSIAPSMMRHALHWLWVVSWAATLLVLPVPSFADCSPSGDFVWSLRKKGALDEFAIALDTNGTLYVDGVVETQRTIDSWLTTWAVTGTTIWKVTNSGGTKVAAVYQNNSTYKWDLVLSGTVVTGNQFSSYSAVTAHWKINDSGGNQLLALKRAGDTLTDGTLLLKCSTEQQNSVGFIKERWDTEGANDLGQPVAFTFIPGHGKDMYVSDRDNGFKVRYIKDEGDHGNLFAGAVVDLISILTNPQLGGINSGQGGPMGIACHPKFADQTPRRYVYIYGTSRTPTPFPNDPYRPNEMAWANRIYRFEVNADLTPIATLPNDLYIYAGNATPTPAYTPFTEGLDHYGGCLRSYKKDNKAYLLLSTGCVDHENDLGKMSGRPQDARVLVGKMLRWEIEDDGDLVIPSDNPFERWTPTLTPPAGGTPIPTPTLRYPRREVIASGFRNPWTFALRPGPTPGVPIEAWVSSVGGVGERGFEEVDRVDLVFTAGGDKSDYKNYGFPRVEGNSDGTTPWPTPTPPFEYYTGCDSSCSQNNGGDLSEKGSLPHVPFSDLEPPSIYYRRFFENPPGYNAGTVSGGAFISTDTFPASFLGDFLFLDWSHGSISRIPAPTINTGTPYRIQSLEELKWFDTHEHSRNLDMLEGPDGFLYYTWDPGTGVSGGVNRFRPVQ